MVLTHFDLELVRVLRAGSDPPFPGCYVWPPIGGYEVHPSGCDRNYDNDAGRPAEWTSPWSCPGTRRAEDPKKRHKWLCAFVKTRPVKWLAKVDLDAADRELHWRSWWAGRGARPRPPEPVEPPATGSWHGARGGGKGGPAAAAATAASSSHASGSGSAAGEPSAPAAGRTTADGEPTAPPAEEPEDTPTLTRRAKRELRGQRLYSGFRVWVHERSEASPVCRPRKTHSLRLKVRLSRAVRARRTLSPHSSLPIARSPPMPPVGARRPASSPQFHACARALHRRTMHEGETKMRVSPPPPHGMRRTTCRALCDRRRTPSWASRRRTSASTTRRTLRKQGVRILLPSVALSTCQCRADPGGDPNRRPLASRV